MQADQGRPTVINIHTWNTHTFTNCWVLWLIDLFIDFFVILISIVDISMYHTRNYYFLMFIQHKNISVCKGVYIFPSQRSRRNRLHNSSSMIYEETKAPLKTSTADIIVIWLVAITSQIWIANPFQSHIHYELPSPAVWRWQAAACSTVGSAAWHT